MFYKSRTKYKGYSDEKLIEIIKLEDNSYAFEEIYLRYGHLTIGLCMKYLKNIQDAEDTCMNIFEKLSVKIKNHQIQVFKFWFYQLAKNECLMVLRKKKSSHFTEKELSDIKVDIEEYSINNDLEIKLELIEANLSLLKDEQRNCIEEFYINSKSYKEISDLFQLDINKVKSAIQNGKRNLKIMLEENQVFKN